MCSKILSTHSGKLLLRFAAACVFLLSGCAQTVGATLTDGTTPIPAEKANPQGKDLLNRSYYPTSADTANVSKKWFVIDAEGKTLGRLACLAAMTIRCVYV